MIRQYKDITYSLARSDRKTASIYIERNGQVSVLAPQRLTDAQVEALIESKRYWIYSGLAEWRDLNAAKVQRAFVNGEGFLYLGRSYRLRLVEDQDEPLVLKNGYFCLHRNGTRTTGEMFSDVFKDFYRVRGSERIQQRVSYYQRMLGVEAKSVNVLELQNRWASCSAKARLNFHWKCMMAPPTILDYIVVHELAHIRYANHTRAFWGEVDKILPDYLSRKQWLRDNGAGMDL
jgi:predicted metal-dependent hydrolase